MTRKARLTHQGPPLFSIRLLRESIEEGAGYPVEVPSIGSLDTLDIRERVLFFVGDNGTGKSTLLEAIAVACGFAPQGGTRNMHAADRISAKRNEDDAELAIRRLADALRLSWRSRQRDGFFFRSETFYDFASHVDRSERESGGFSGAYGGQSLHDYSHGESFLTLFLTRFSASGLFLLDEPEAALSPTRQLAMLRIMRDLLAQDYQTQFIIATHSPILLAYPQAQIMTFDGHRVREITYRETDPFNITRRFLAGPEDAIRSLFDDSEET